MAVEQLIAELRGDISHFRAEMRKANQVADDTSRKIEQGNRRLGASFSTVRASVAGFGAAIAGLGLIRLGQDIAQTGIRLQSLQNAFKAITGSADGARRELSFVRRESERLGLEFLSTARAFQGISAAARGTSLAGQNIREAFLGVVEAGTVLGLSSDEVGGALAALSQIISKGTVQAEELRGQLGERIPGAFHIAARAMGVTTQALDKMLEQGEIVATDFIPRFASQMRKEFGGAAVEAADNARQSFNRFQNAVTELKAAIVETGFLDAIVAVANALTRIMRLLSGSEVINASDEVEKLSRRLRGLQESLKGLGPINPIIEQIFGDLGRGETRRRVAAEIEQIQQAIAAFKGKVDDLGVAFGALADDALKATAKQESQIKSLKDSLDSLGVNKIKDLREDIEKLERILANQEGLGLTADQALLARNRLEDLREELRNVQESAQRYQETVSQQMALDALGEMGEAWGRLEQDIEEGTRAAKEYEDQLFEIRAQQFGLDELGAAWGRLEQDIEEGTRSAEKFEKQQEKLEADRLKKIERELREREREFDQFAGRIEDRLANVFERALKGNITNAAEFFRDTFFSVIAQVAARALTTEIVIPVLRGTGIGPGSTGTSLSDLVGGIGRLFGRNPANEGLRFGSPRGSELAAGNIPTAGGGASFGQVAGGAALGFGASSFLSSFIPGASTTPGQIGGFLGGAGGGIGGALLGQALIPIPGVGAAIGGLLGGLFGGAGGGFLGGLFSKPDPKSRAAFRTSAFNTGFEGGRPGARGPFGFVGLDDALTRFTSPELDQELTNFILNIDQTAAAVLDARQKQLATEALQRQGVTAQQFFRNFDNEATAVVFDRLSRIMAAIGENPSQVLTGTSAGELQQQFERFFGRQRFDESIADAILGFTDPQGLELRQLERAQEERIAIAKELGANLVEVERLNALERQRVLEKTLGETLEVQVDTIRAFLVDITSGTASGVLPLSTRLSNAQREFELQRSRALSGNLNQSALVSASQNLLSVTREQFASGPQFFQVLSFVQRSLENVIGSATGSGSGIGAVAANTGETNTLLDQLLDQNATLTAEMIKLRQRLDRLVA